MTFARSTFASLATTAPAGTSAETSRANSPASTRNAKKTTRRSLSLKERINYQRAIEQVYWNHRVWPQQEGAPSSAQFTLDESVPMSATQAKVEDALRRSAALEKMWQQPVTAEMLQAEIERMARETKQPEILRELWDALESDPFIIAECLARPLLVERLTRDLYASDQRFHVTLKAQVMSELGEKTTIERLDQLSGDYSVEEWAKSNHKSTNNLTNKSNPEIAQAARVLQLTPDEWNERINQLAQSFVKDNAASSVTLCSSCAQTTTKKTVGASGVAVDGVSVGMVSPLQEDERRFFVTAVIARNSTRLKIATVAWPKTSFEQWWANARQDFAPQVQTDSTAFHIVEITGTAASCTDDTWTPIKALPVSLGTAVWTGTEMIIWGTGTNSGSRYNPTTDTWTPTSAIDAPAARGGHSAIWTGTEMIIWGGCRTGSTSFCGLQTGGRYNPTTDTWTPTSITNAPNARSRHTAVWTGSKMIVWGGCQHRSNNQCLTINSGGVYDPVSDTWTLTSSTNAPTARASHTAVWTGSEMIVWGGTNNSDGGRYNPAIDTWTPTSLVNAPSPRVNHTAVWTGSEMIIWGGSSFNGQGPLNTGGRYNPANDTWTPTNTAGAPAPRYNHTAVWTGTEMIVWGGDLGDASPGTNTGGRYNPSTDSWTPTNTAGAPPPRALHRAVWTGSIMIVWSSADNNKASGRYNPATDSWQPTDTNDSVPASSDMKGVWTGTEMLVWGGFGGGYNPATNSWRTISTLNAPTTGFGNTVIWTGTEMIVWGGQYGTSLLNEGGRYNPTTDTWQLTSLTNAPSPRAYHTAVWTGSEMIIWSGEGGSNIGGRYNPSNNTWTPTSTVNAPAGRYIHTAVWTGSEMIVWGGVADAVGSGAHYNTGGRYNPSTDSWTPTSNTNAPSIRRFHTAIWTGTEMIVWGGRTGDFNSPDGLLNTGGRYNPANDSWQPTSAVGVPSQRFYHTAVWTGSLMIVWGGYTPGNMPTHTGARYSPTTDTWQPTSNLRAASDRAQHVAVWTGTQMIVWGGFASQGAASHGAAYCAPGGSSGNAPPTVNITNPTEGANFNSGANIVVTANAADTDGTINNVSFYANSTFIGSDNTAPYSITWNNVRGGTYALTAVATDNNGTTTLSAAINITVNVSVAPPTVRLTSPVNGAIYNDLTSIYIAATASANNDRTIAKVDFYNGAQLIYSDTSSPYGGFSTGGLSAGSYTFTAVATDSAGISATSDPVTVTVTSTANNVRITGTITDGTGNNLQNITVRLDSPQLPAPVFGQTNFFGVFQFGNLTGGYTYTVTPTTAPYAFAPASRTFVALTVNEDDANFTATIGHDIHGQVVGNDGLGLGGVTLTLSGTLSRTTTTDDDGFYVFANLSPNAPYTVTPSKQGYSFSPPSRTYPVLNGSEEADFFGETAPFNITGHVADANGNPIIAVTLTLTGDHFGTPVLETAITDASGNYTFANLFEGGDYTITPVKIGYTFDPPQRTFTDLSANQTANFTGTFIVLSGNIIISEFRLRGPAGAQDEFAELYNNTDSPITIGAADDSNGWAIVVFGDSSPRFVVPNGTVIPARGHYLAINNVGYASPTVAGNEVNGDLAYASDIPDNIGLALFRTTKPQNFTTSERLDAVGFNTQSGATADLYREGSGLTPIASSVGANDQFSFVRKMGTEGIPQDTGDNAADFVLISPNGNSFGGSVNAAIGQPGPESLDSPRSNRQIIPSLIDPATASSLSPNRVRLFCGDAGAPACPADPNTSSNGYLSIRRKFTNRTGQSITRLRFRITDITTLNNTDGLPAPVADLRVISSSDVNAMVFGVPMLVRGTTLDQAVLQTNGGGLNSTLSAGTVTLSTPLPIEGEINVQFLMGLKSTGRFRFFVNVEALP
jgi:N-acetylneuraminic acid mutarotase